MAFWSMYFTATWYILWPFWYVFPVFGVLYQEKSGNPGYARARIKKTSIGDKKWVVSCLFFWATEMRNHLDQFL
jgi:hypothetical protein